MKPRGRLVARLILPALVLPALLAPCPSFTSAVAVCKSCPPAEAGKTADESPLLAGRPEMRLRKLHLVRPDLIPYPIAYETYC